MNRCHVQGCVVQKPFPDLITFKQQFFLRAVWKYSRECSAVSFQTTIDLPKIELIRVREGFSSAL